MKCKCIKKIQDMCRKKYNAPEGELNSCWGFSIGETTYTDFTWETYHGKTQRAKKHRRIIAHSYCPFCGKKIEHKSQLTETKSDCK